MLLYDVLAQTFPVNNIIHYYHRGIVDATTDAITLFDDDQLYA